MGYIQACGVMLFINREARSILQSDPEGMEPKDDE